LSDQIAHIYQQNLAEIESSLVHPLMAYKKLIYNKSDMPMSEFALKFASILVACKIDLRQELDYPLLKTIRNVIIEKSLVNVICTKKPRVYVEKSRFLMGITDETGKLADNEVYVSYRDPRTGFEQYLHNVDVLVARTPCYGLSELRRLRAKYVPGMRHLVNCIAFPQRGSTRPLTNVLSGGDLDGDLYFVCWDQSLVTAVVNSPTLIAYPEKTSSPSTQQIGRRVQQRDLVAHFVGSCLKADSIGLVHHNLISQYDQSRENMKKAAYLDQIIKINRAIDGLAPVSSSGGSGKAPFVKTPDWHLAKNELKPVYSARSKEDKIDALYDILSKKRPLSPDQLEQSSLVGRLMHATIQMFLKVCRASRDENESIRGGRFLKKEEIDLLMEHRLIDTDLDDIQLSDENLARLKRRYAKYVQDVMAIESKENSLLGNGWCGETGDAGAYMGSIERQAIADRVLKLSELKLKLANDFKRFVIDLDYMTDERDLPEFIRRSMHTPNDIFIRTRVVRLYEIYGQHSSYYQIPWIFYEILAYLKNSLSQPNSIGVPLTVSAQHVPSITFNRISQTG
jgi:hypothetical protein